MYKLAAATMAAQTNMLQQPVQTFKNPPMPKFEAPKDPIKPQPVGEGQKDITPPAVSEPPQMQETGNATFSSYLQNVMPK